MKEKITKEHKKLICDRVKQVRIAIFGEDRGAQKQMAKEMGLKYTTYRGYESDRFNLNFLIEFAKKWKYPLDWLLGIEAMTSKDFEDILINTKELSITATKFKIMRMPDNEMEEIPVGSFVVYDTNLKENLHNKICVIRKGTIETIRKIQMKDNTYFAIGKNIETIEKKDILGIVRWTITKY